MELSQNRCNASFKHADYEYGHDFDNTITKLVQMAPKNGTNDQKLILHRIVSKSVQCQFSNMLIMNMDIIFENFVTKLVQMAPKNGTNDQK